jgi:hypothetical protein
MEFVLCHVGRKDEYFSQRSQGARTKIGFNHTMMSRRAKGRYFVISENSPNPEKVKSIADSNNPSKIVLFEEFNSPLNTLTGCHATGLGVDAIFRDTLFYKIHLAHPRF